MTSVPSSEGAAPAGRRRVPARFGPPIRRATIIGAGSFGTALAVVFARSGTRTVLQARTAEQAELLAQGRENSVYLPGVELPPSLRIECAGTSLARSSHVFLAVPSRFLDSAAAQLDQAGLPRDAAVISLAKGLTTAAGLPPTMLLSERFGAQRVACLGGPAHAQEMVHAGAALVAASTDEGLAWTLAHAFSRAGLVCERSNDPLGVELAGAAKNAAALAAGATETQGLNAAGAAAGHIFAEVWRYAVACGARPESFIGLAGTGDLVATALARESRNRRAGELLAQGVPATEIPGRIGQAIESLESVPLLARTLERSDVRAPVLGALGRLIAGELPLREWVALVRTTVPPPARWRRRRERESGARRRLAGWLHANWRKPRGADGL